MNPRSRPRAVALRVVFALAVMCSTVALPSPAANAQTGPSPVPAPIADPFGPGVISASGLVLPESAGVLVGSSMDLTGVDLLSGGVMPADVTSAGAADSALMADMLSNEQLAAQAARAAEAARLDAERRRRAQASGDGKVPSDVPFADLFNEIAPRYGLDPRMVAAVAKTESSFVDDIIYCRRVSTAGARGLMQFMPGTAAGYGIDPCVPAQAIDGGSRMLSELHGKYNNWDIVFAAYNAGPGNVAKYGGIPPFTETRNYIAKVNQYWEEFKAASPDSGGEAGAYGEAGSGRRNEKGPGGSTVCVSTVRGISVACEISGATDQLLAAAAADGVPLDGWGWRSHETQIRLRTTNGCPDVWNAPASSCRVPTARPGSSQHERGLAIDFKNCASRSTRCYQWLANNASRFGLFNLPSEPWHWSVNGK